ncbi:SCO0930 family lipoprotein [Streptomyces sp. DSM 40750]|uniref:SCO0930 family lipoprotein n=1 Tax=Streptomyces sp. DSM 40750 TaxID=2801030 RepID=UPI00214D0466|nr:SCO0930 family lipoprotein [Streptomyces sp. DSM 40750]UUU26450.1 SCO0930 family lipoprotein [Streptomyces sp. DSM 40750]
MKTSWRSASLVATAAAVLVLTTACGQEQGSTSSQNVGAASTPTLGAGTIAGTGTAGAGTAGSGTSEQAQSTTAAAAGQLTVWNSDEYGKVLTDSAGRTLYRFDKDSFEPPKTTCEGECATTWPPVPASGATAAEGVDKALLGEVSRPDGTKQLTVGGWPMYYFAKDTKAGDIKGQGLKGTWFASDPNGKKASTKGGGAAAGDAGGDAGGEAVEQVGLTTRKDAKLGEIVVDKNGMTVYRFMKDTQWPMSTACTGACLDKWPVVAPVDKNDTKDILLKGYTVFDRPDGIKQQTINCIPLYTFASDKAPGDTNGQGVGGTWFAINGDGEPIGAKK